MPHVRYPTHGLIPQALQPTALAAIAAALVLFIPPLRAEPAAQVRALWVIRTTLTSPSAIATMVSSAKAGGFNTLLVQVRGRGDAYFQRGIEPRPPSLDAQPAFDPLATTIARGHEAGLHVHALINVNLVAGTGITNMRDRLAALGGEVDVAAAAGTCTAVHGRVPTP